MKNSITLQPKPLDAQSFARYGHIISHNKREPAYHCPEFDFYADIAVQEFGYEVAFGMVTARAVTNTANTFERHQRTAELIAPLNGDVIVVLGPRSHDGPPADDQFEAFHIVSGTAIIVNAGIWHFAPLAISDDVSILIGFRNGTPSEDLEVHNLEEMRGTRFVLEM